MSTLTPLTSQTTNQQQSISDAVLEYMTSLKAVKKRDGTEQEFSAEKLSGSITRAMQEAGLKDALVLSRIVEQVIGRLVRTFDGHTVPTTSDIREVVNMTFIDHNLVHVSKKYASFRLERRVSSQEAVYGHGITMNRYFTTPGKHPYELLTWEKRTAKITDEKGEVVF